MAENKYFLVTDKTNQAQTVAGAPNKGIAITLAAGSEGGFKVATNHEVAIFFTPDANGDKKQIHAASTPAGKYFISGESDAPILIRAKNAGAAFAAVNADRYEIELLKTDKLVDLLSAGVKQVRYQAPEPKTVTDGANGPDVDDNAGASGTNDGADSTDAGATETLQDSSAADESTQDGGSTEEAQAA